MSDEQALTTISPAVSAAEFKKNHQSLTKFVADQLKEAKNIGNGDGGDYGIIPYTKKKSLLKPGAEKLLKLFGFSATNELVKEIEDWEKGFVYYKYKCTVVHIASGKFMADATRTCNNKEKKHAGKTVYDAANTVESVAQKRALVAATVQATMASEIFDADISDHDEDAPNKTVTRKEDPRRIKIFAGLYGKASARGIDDKWLHAAAKKKWEVESLTDLSNEQLEELTEVILQHFDEVPKGSLRKPKNAITPQGTESGAIGEESVQDGEIVDSNYYCKGPKHDTPERQVKTSLDNPWCEKQCEDDYYGVVDKRKRDFQRQQATNR